MARVTQPGFRNKTLPRRSFRGTCVCPCSTKSTPSGVWSGGMCCRRNFNPLRTRSTTSGQSRLLSQFPRTTVIGGPTARSSSIMTSVQTSPKCQISSALLAISFTLPGKRLCVSAITKMRRASSFDSLRFAISELSQILFAPQSRSARTRVLLTKEVSNATLDWSRRRGIILAHGH